MVAANTRAAALFGAPDPGALAGRELGELLAEQDEGLPDSGRTVRCGARSGASGIRPVEARCALSDRPEADRVVVVSALPPAEPTRGGPASRELERLRERLAAEIAEREELLTVVSHELRTPLTVMVGSLRVLVSEGTGPLNDEQRRFLCTAERACRRLDALIGNLIETSRQSEREEPLQLCEASLEETLRSAVALLRPLLEERGIRLDLALAPEAARARFHPLRIEQVLTNLIANAIRYAAKGGRIEVATRRVGAAGSERVEVAVSDDGPGVPAADRERIFRPWVHDRHEGGLGLGLAICRRIVEAHGGSIGLGDAPGGGSRFAFTVPAAAPAARLPLAREAAR